MDDIDGDVVDVSSVPFILCNPDRAYYRFVVLFFNCMLTFGSYFCFDMPSVLQDNFTGKFGWNCTNDTKTNTTICIEHLGLSETEYNLLYTVYAWMNAVVVVGSGVLVDKFGHRIGALIFSALCVIGSTIFAAGYLLKGTKAMFALFLLGRLIFGAGNGSLTIAQNKISAVWFEGKELAFAFGVTLAFSRLGSVINFLFTRNFVKLHGLKWTLWGGAMLCGTGFMAAIVVFFLDKIGAQRLEQLEEKTKKPRKKMRFSDIRYLSLQFWLLVLTTMFFYNTVFPFVADASQFLEETYNFSEKKSSYIAGSVYDISLLLTPLLGLSVDYVGYRGILATSCALFTIPVFAILAFTSLHPLVGTLLLGVTYSAAAGSLWPSVPLVVNPGVLGTALGLMTSVQMVGIGICNLVVGSILDLDKESVHKWKYVMIFLFANAVLCVVTSICLNFVDWKRDGILNKTKKRKKRDSKVLNDGCSDALISDDIASDN